MRDGDSGNNKGGSGLKIWVVFHLCVMQAFISSGGVARVGGVVIPLLLTTPSIYHLR